MIGDPATNKTEPAETMQNNIRNILLKYLPLSGSFTLLVAESVQAKLKAGYKILTIEGILLAKA